MDPAGTRLPERLGYGDGIDAVESRLVGGTLAETHDAPALHVNGGVQVHWERES